VLRENQLNFADVLHTNRLRVVPDFPEQFSLRVKKDLFSKGNPESAAKLL